MMRWLERGEDVSPLVTKWVPVTFLGLFVLLFLTIHDTWFYDLFVRSEFGFVENGTFVCALFITALAILTLPYATVMPPAWCFRVFLVVLACGGLFLAGEEISWGQHFLGWGSPAYFLEHNIQGETNLHNLTELSERAPKALLQGAVIFGGIVWPLMVWSGLVRAPRPPSMLYWLMPTRAVVVAAVVAIGVRIFERSLMLLGFDHQGLVLKEFKELIEFFLVFFVLVYVLSLYQRARWWHLQMDERPLAPDGSTHNPRPEVVRSERQW